MVDVSTVDAARPDPASSVPTEGDRPRSLQRRDLAVLFVAFWVLGACWSLMTPVMGSYDEPAHAVKAVSIWHGQLRGKRIEVPGQASEAAMNLVDVVEVPADYATLQGIHGCFVVDGRTPDCARDVDHNRALVKGFTSAGPYPPLYYVLVGWPSRIFDAPAGVYAMRIVSAGWIALFVAIAAAGASLVMARRALVAVTMAAAVPMLWFLGGSINPNGLECAAALAMWMTWSAWWQSSRPSRRCPGWLPPAALASAAVLAGCRSLSPAFMLAIAALTWIVERPRPRTVRHFYSLAAVLGVVTAASGWWIVANKHLTVILGTRLAPGESPLRALVGLVPEWVMQTFADVGWGEVPARPMAALALGVVLALVVTSRRRAPNGESTLAVLLLIGVVVAPVFLQLPSVSRYGVAWQGRYLLPILIGVPVLAGLALARGGHDHTSESVVWWRRSLLVSGVAGVGTLAMAAQHYRLGSDVGFFVLEGRWSPPLGATTIVVAALLAWVVIDRVAKWEP